MFRETYEELRKADQATLKTSQKRARKLLDGLLDGSVSGPNGSRSIGTTIYLLAVAEQRLGRSDDAAWHWQMAQNFAPELRDAYDDFADVVPFLRDHLISAKRWEFAAQRERGETATGSMLPLNRGVDPEKLKGPVVPPLLKRKVDPRYPQGAREHHLEGTTEIMMWIDKEGVPREPTVHKGCGATVLDVTAMDAVGQWRFKPASVSAQPVEVWYFPAVTFERKH
jgi:TonB family protein